MNGTKQTFPLVSICIPVFNGGDLISHALDSCIGQTYKNIEIIVSDNASSDNTREVVERYAASDKRIKYFNHKINIGSSKNFLSVAEFASGDYVQLLAHDDWLSRNYIEECVASFSANPRAAVITGGLLSIKLLENGFFNFDREIGVVSKRVSVQHFLRDLQNNQMASLIIYSMARRQDFLDALRLSSEIFDTPSVAVPEEIQKLHKKGYGIDIVISQKLISNYDYFYFNNNIRYAKVEHTANTGDSAGEGLNMRNAKGIVGNYFYFLFCNEYLYSTLFKKHLFKMRLVVGKDLLGTLIFNLFKSRNRADYFKGFNFKLLAGFFKKYSLSEKVAVILTFIPSLIARLLSAATRRSVKKREPPFVKNNFLNSKGEFTT